MYVGVRVGGGVGVGCGVVWVGVYGCAVCFCLCGADEKTSNIVTNQPPTPTVEEKRKQLPSTSTTLHLFS